MTIAPTSVAPPVMYQTNPGVKPASAPYATTEGWFNQLNVFEHEEIRRGLVKRSCDRSPYEVLHILHATSDAVFGSTSNFREVLATAQPPQVGNGTLALGSKARS